jgi:hypothetical protein
MFDFNAPNLTDEGARAFADFGAAALNTSAAKVFASSAKVLSWSVAIVAVGWVSLMLIRELRGETVKHDVTHRGAPPSLPLPSPPPSPPPAAV